MSQSACTETQPKTPNSKQCRCRSTGARKNSLERPEPRKKPREEPGSEGWPVLFWLCRVEIIKPYLLFSPLRLTGAYNSLVKRSGIRWHKPCGNLFFFRRTLTRPIVCTALGRFVCCLFFCLLFARCVLGTTPPLATSGCHRSLQITSGTLSRGPRRLDKTYRSNLPAFTHTLRTPPSCGAYA